VCVCACDRLHPRAKPTSVTVRAWATGLRRMRSSVRRMRTVSRSADWRTVELTAPYSRIRLTASHLFSRDRRTSRRTGPCSVSEPARSDGEFAVGPVLQRQQFSSTVSDSAHRWRDTASARHFLERSSAQVDVSVTRFLSATHRHSQRSKRSAAIARSTKVTSSRDLSLGSEDSDDQRRSKTHSSPAPLPQRPGTRRTVVDDDTAISRHDLACLVPAMWAGQRRSS
jgi:hypothetical protein